MFLDFRSIVTKLRHLDWLSLSFQLVLLAIGVVFIYGAGIRIGGAFVSKWYVQLFWIAVGFVIFLICALIDYRKLGEQSWILYLLGVILLGLVISKGVNINGAKSWIRIAGFTIQPSEFAKPATLLFMSWIVTRPGWLESRVPPWLIVGLTLLPPLFLVFKQPDMGTLLVFLPFSFCIAFIKGLRWRWIILTVTTGIVLAPFAFMHLATHQKERIKVFLNEPTSALISIASPYVSSERAKKWNEAYQAFFYPELQEDKSTDTNAKDPAATTQKAKRKARKIDNWNAKQSMLSVGSGGFTGKGFMQGTQYYLGYLPRTVAPTDFIFSVIAEETGFLGCGLVILLLTCIILCSCRTAVLAADEMGMCLALGTAAILTTHSFINIAMTIQVAPIIGIPLPFISYGGSFMISIMTLTGLCQSVHIHRHNLPEFL
ncbi:MAG: rod shape-determining protein RodA [Victivallales bacterium]|nr:rod shape-determining protein RodA [Victivallales bacterium]